MRVPALQAAERRPGRRQLSHGLMITALLAFSSSLGLFNSSPPIRIRACHDESARAQAHAALPIREPSPSPIEPGKTAWLGSWKQASKRKKGAARARRSSFIDRSPFPTKGRGQQVVWHRSDRVFVSAAFHSSRALRLHRCGGLGRKLLFFLPGAATASHLHLVCRSIILPWLWLGRTQSCAARAFGGCAAQESRCSHHSPLPARRM